MNKDLKNKRFRGGQVGVLMNIKCVKVQLKQTKKINHYIHDSCDLNIAQASSEEMKTNLSGAKRRW